MNKITNKIINKKLLFIFITLFTVILGTCSVNAACSIWRYKFDVKKVRINTTWSGDDAPVMAIGWSRDHTQDMTFYAELKGAEWNYSKSGTIQQGVTYTLEDKQTLAIHVKVGTGSDEIQFNNGRNIYIPLYCTITGAGDIRFIVDSNESTVSSTNIVVAKSIDGTLSVSSSKAAIHQTGELKNITISDSSTQSYATNNRFTLELDTSFHFTGKAEVTGTGKFADRVRFEVDKNNSQIAYVYITGTTTEERGTIIIKGAEVTRKSDKKFNVALLKTTFTASAVPLSSSIAIASYKAEETTTETTTEATTTATTKATTQSTTETTTETTTEAPTSSVQQIKIQIGASHYTIDGESYSLDAPAYISNGSTMLPLRAIANAIGITDDKVSFNAQTKTATLSTASASAEITADSDNIAVTGNGLVVNVRSNAPAEITNGRLFLPLRAMANALGISENAISYDASSETVTITR
jgi:hypothetical protein